MRAGCAWRLLPQHLPPWQTVYHYWRKGRQVSVWERMLTALRERERVRLGRDPAPGPGIVDCQSVRASDAVPARLRRRQEGQRDQAAVAGRHPGHRPGRLREPSRRQRPDGATVLFARAVDAFPRLGHVWADQGYRGADFHAWIPETTGITVEIAQLRDGGSRSTWARAGTTPREVPVFAVVPRRWVVERLFAWLGRCRRLSKDYEYLRGNSENVIHLAMAMLLVRRLTRTTR
ncbi:transposase [Streptomyces sp. NPDC001795]|uniref:transposase n=1 Tax=Streptomyces sp. NPDC001795 TaxID=3154525 RepID=UPI00332DEBFB